MSGGIGGPGDSIGSGPSQHMGRERSMDSATSTSSAKTSQIFESNLTETSEQHDHAAVVGGEALDLDVQLNSHQRLRWQLGKCIGSGAFAEVYQGIDTETGRFLAVKQVKLKNGAAAAAQALQREIGVMTQLPHHRSFKLVAHLRLVTLIPLQRFC